MGKYFKLEKAQSIGTGSRYRQPDIYIYILYNNNNNNNKFLL
jgi:hypothetical protein